LLWELVALVSLTRSQTAGTPEAVVILFLLLAMPQVVVAGARLLGLVLTLVMAAVMAELVHPAVVMVLEAAVALVDILVVVAQVASITVQDAVLVVLVVAAVAVAEQVEAARDQVLPVVVPVVAAVVLVYLAKVQMVLAEPMLADSKMEIEAVVALEVQEEL
jgi:hypothetical protein